MKLFARLAASAAVMIGLATPALAERENPDELFFGILSTESSSAQREKWGPLLAAMQASIGRPVKPFFASDYAGVIEAMRFDKVDVVWYGNKSAMVAVDRAGAEVFAQTTESTGDQGYWSVMITHKDSGLTYEDVMKCDKTLNFGIGDPNSTSGFLVPSTFVFAKEGVNPKDCFKTVRNANHETNLISAATKQVDAAVASSTGMYSRLKNAKPELFAELKEIWRSPLIASDPMAWRPELDKKLKADILSFFMSYGRLGTDEEVAEARETLALIDMGPFVPSSNAQLWPFYEMDQIRQRMSIEADTTYSDDERTAKILEINTRIEEIRAAAAARPRK
ncbi:phosphonate ABC transporter substrate-binding protein [Roseibium polysiphoniae]|uniref:Phosphonate ABC transporter substrate-binding protein n=1 Tax=Roseibium polysiphoniae TaxID=2571221 RepID=A0ABR9C9J9_9HYPH|nr:phosphonate ABC transporter substrate-binding protein [Roseibium polysiphoniae]MBD8875735.1 phosphonate ABC transporter substrate-binding protein [Roseibium polysiphoniae]